MNHLILNRGMILKEIPIDLHALTTVEVTPHLARKILDHLARTFYLYFDAEVFYEEVDIL
jgi:hypothetical protein